MTSHKIIAISGLAFLLAGVPITATAIEGGSQISGSQQQVESAAPAVEAPVSVENKHQLPDGSYHTHSHIGGNDTSHGHSVAQIKQDMGQ